MLRTFDQFSRMNFSMAHACNVSLNSSYLKTSTSYPNVSAVLPWLFSRLRIFLYLSNPYEESFEFHGQVADYHTETMPILVAFVFLEWILLFIKGKPLPLLGDSFASASMIVMMECTRILTRGVEHTAYIYIYRHYRLIDLPWNSAFTWYFAAVFVDFCYYWGHRISHECNVLWAHHQAHHSSENYSLVNTFRLPFSQDWLYAFCYLPMALFISPAHYLVHHQLNLLYQFWLHTDMIGKLGALEWILNTPSHHRDYYYHEFIMEMMVEPLNDACVYTLTVHHGCNKFCLDKNYGAWLIIWDRMFGTFQEEKEDEEIVYGLVEPVQSFNPLYLQVFYFGKLYEKWCSMDGLNNKLLSLLKGPGWTPGSPWTGDLDLVPEVKGRKKYLYNTRPFLWNVYMFIHFFIVLIGYQAVSLLRTRMTPWAVFFHLFYVIFSFASMGLFFDGNQLAPVFEIIRCALFFIYSANGVPLLTNLLSWFGYFNYTMEAQIYWLLRTYFFSSTVFWTTAFLTKNYPFKVNFIDAMKHKLT